MKPITRYIATSALAILVVIKIIEVDSYPVQTTKEVDLSSQLDVKEKPLQEDIDQFFLDQDHLIAHKANGTEQSSGSGWSTGPVDVTGLITQLIAFDQLLQQYGLPSMNPSQMGMMFISMPMGWISQYMNSDRGSNLTRPMTLMDNIDYQ
jgi:hypothetical protein